MLRQIIIIYKNEIIYQKDFSKSLKKEVFIDIYPNIVEDVFSNYGKEIGDYDFYKWKISYIAEKSVGLLIIFVSGLTDRVDILKTQLFKLQKEFLNLFGEIIETNKDLLMFEVLDPLMVKIHRSLSPKISLIGFSGVGKTTITKLIRSEEIPTKHIPTITGDIATIQIGNLQFRLWDFAGQEQFSFLWNNFIKGSDAVLLITDSTLSNIEHSKFFLDLISEEAPYAHSAIIANKQDLDGALRVDSIEGHMGLKTYSMIAIEANNKIKMIQIIADVLEMDPEVSPLLKPLFERDRLIETAQNAINQEDYEQTVLLFDQIGDICIDIGDDSLGLEFKEKSDQIRQILSSSS